MQNFKKKPIIDRLKASEVVLSLPNPSRDDRHAAFETKNSARPNSKDNAVKACADYLSGDALGQKVP